MIDFKQFRYRPSDANKTIVLDLNEDQTVTVRWEKVVLKEPVVKKRWWRR
jgi:hypothetical protein